MVQYVCGSYWILLTSYAHNGTGERAAGNDLGMAFGSVVWAWVVFGWTARSRRWVPRAALILLILSALGRHLAPA